MVDLLFVSWNRLEFCKASFQALVDGTDWSLVRNLHLHDDGSSDGAAQWLLEASEQVPENVKVLYESMRLGGPVAAMVRHLDLCKPSDDCGAFVKLDNDFVVCPGWLPELLRQTVPHPGIEIFGIQPRLGPPTAIPDYNRTVEDCRHIGGIGLMRYRAFEVCRPTPNGLYGWSEYQVAHKDIRKCWVKPDLPCFSLDLIDAEPWASLSAEYIAKGWQREWAKYVDGGRGYHEWFTAPVPA